MLVYEKKEYIILARANEGFHGQVLTEENLDNFIKEILNHFYITLVPYRVTMSEYSKNDKGDYTFRLVTWESPKK